MENFALACVIAVVVLTLIAVGSVTEGSQAGVMGATTARSLVSVWISSFAKGICDEQR